MLRPQNHQRGVAGSLRAAGCDPSPPGLMVVPRAPGTARRTLSAGGVPRTAAHRDREFPREPGPDQPLRAELQSRPPGPGPVSRKNARRSERWERRATLQRERLVPSSPDTGLEGNRHKERPGRRPHRSGRRPGDRFAQSHTHRLTREAGVLCPGACDSPPPPQHTRPCISRTPALGRAPGDITYTVGSGPGRREPESVFLNGGRGLRSSVPSPGVTGGPLPQADGVTFGVIPGECLGPCPTSPRPGEGGFVLGAGTPGNQSLQSLLSHEAESELGLLLSLLRVGRPPAELLLTSGTSGSPVHDHGGGVTFPPPRRDPGAHS